MGRAKMIHMLAAMIVVASAGLSAAGHPRGPIMLDRSGGFSVGGKVLVNPEASNETLSCGHGYVEYFIPWKPRATSIVMWHSSSTQTFQNRWDGGEGYKDIFLRRDYPVYLWEGPAVGRANWDCKPYTYEPAYRDQGNFVAWNLGPAFMDYWPGVQFPKDNMDSAWDQATRGRYIEFDNEENVQLHSDVAAVAADSGRLGDSIVYIANSASGCRALLTAIKSKSKNIKAVVIYETAGAVLPDNVGVPPPEEDNGFGPFLIPVEDFKKLAEIEAVQFVWGDHRGNNEDQPGARVNWTEQVIYSRLASDLINKYGGNSEVLMLRNDLGLEGNTHIAFMDMNNDKIADILENFLAKNDLSGYAKLPKS